MSDDLTLWLVKAADDAAAGTGAEPFPDVVERAVRPLLPPEKVRLVGRLAWLASKALRTLPDEDRRDLLQLLGAIDQLGTDGRTAAQILGQTFHPSTDLGSLS